MGNIFIHFFAGVLFAITGFLLYCSFIYRFFTLIRHLIVKRIVVFSALFLLLIVPFVLGLLMGYNPQYLPVYILILILLTGIWVHRLVMRVRYPARQADEKLARPIKLYRPFTTFDTAYFRYKVPLTGSDAKHFRVVQISDLHLNAEFPEKNYRTVIENIIRLKPDLVFICGDLINERADPK
ncbi:MAG: hypothetical protein GX811_01940 [Lentisphaerae bacterium]|nr:hypothetical protein [Lentisphaerota bacterium]